MITIIIAELYFSMFEIGSYYLIRNSSGHNQILSSITVCFCDISVFLETKGNFRTFVQQKWLSVKIMSVWYFLIK